MAADVRAFTRDPAREVERQPIAGGALIIAALVAVAYARRRTMPTRDQLVSYVAAAAVVVLVSRLRMTWLTLSLIAGLGFAVYRDPDVATAAIAQARARAGV